jgi:hypothetical protein
MMPVANNWNYIVAAYSVAWAGVIGYWIFTHRALRSARARYEQALATARSADGKSS